MPASTAVFASTPRVFIDGEEKTDLTRHLLEMFVEETQDGLFRAEATFINWGPKDGAVGYLYTDRRILDFGKTLKFEAGNGEGQGRIFEGRIMALEGRYLRDREPELLVLAEDRLQDLRMKRRTRTFEDVSDADVMRQIASDHGLQSDVDVDGPTHRVLAQLNQSDLAFVRERARAVDAEVWLEDGSLKVKARSRRNQGEVRLALLEKLRECSILADLAGQYTGYAVAGWDVAAKEGIRFEASDSVIQGELEGGTSGSSELSRAVGDRVQQIVHRAPLTSDEAQSLAEGEFRRMARRFLRGSILADGDARLRVGAFVDLDGLGTLFDGKYYITRVRHTFRTSSGLWSECSVEKPGIGS